MKTIAILIVSGLICGYSYSQDLSELPPISQPEQSQNDDLKSQKTELAISRPIVSHSYLQHAYSNPNSYPDDDLLKGSEPKEIIASGVNYLVLRRTSGPNISIKIKEKVKK